MPTIIYGSGSADFHTPLAESEGGTGATSISLGQVFPLGMIIPIASNLTGTYTIPSSGSVDSDGWMYCNGAAIPAGKSVSGTTPNLTDGRFLRGSTSSGGTGGSATFTLATANIPSHTHTTSAHTHSTAAHTHTTPAHSHSASSANAGNHSHVLYVARDSYGTGDQLTGDDTAGNDEQTYTGKTGGTTNTAGDHSHGITVNSGGSGTSGSTSAGNTGSGGGAATGATGSTTAVTHLPIYVNAQYLIKVNA